MPGPYMDSVIAAFTAYCVPYNSLYGTAGYYAQMAALGARPVFPVFVVNDSDYGNVVTAQGIWDSALSTIRTGLAFTVCIHDTTTHPDGSGLLEALYSLMDSNNWYALTAVTTGDFTPYPDAVWVAYPQAANGADKRIIVLTSEPLLPFPNLETA